jgi:hypothetical protein
MSMSGVFTAIYVLTFTCYGDFCGPLHGVSQRVALPTGQACEYLRDAVMSRSNAQAVLKADCVGEVREVPAPGWTVRK